MPSTWAPSDLESAPGTQGNRGRHRWRRHRQPSGRPQGPGGGATGRRRHLRRCGDAHHQRCRPQYRRRAALEFMAKGTGGRTFMPSIGADLDKAFTDIITDLRTQYLLGYYPQNVPPSERALPQTGSARHAGPICGFRRATAIMGESREAAVPRMIGSAFPPAGRNRNRSRKSSLRRNLRHLPENLPRARRNKRLKRPSISSG